MEKENVRTEIAQTFSDISRNTGKVSFKITYTATEGNIGVDKRFQDFCFNYANNEYLAGISKLLDYYEMLKDKQRIENYLGIVEQRLQALEHKDKEEVETNDSPIIKTF